MRVLRCTQAGAQGVGYLGTYPRVGDDLPGRDAGGRVVAQHLPHLHKGEGA